MISQTSVGRRISLPLITGAKGDPGGPTTGEIMVSSKLLASVMLSSTMLLVSACGGGTANETAAPVEANVPPAVSGISSQKVQAELDGLDCATTRSNLSGLTEDLYFGTMASYVSGGQGGTEAEWRAAIDWWWQEACGGQ